MTVKEQLKRKGYSIEVTPTKKVFGVPRAKLIISKGKKEIVRTASSPFDVDPEVGEELFQRNTRILVTRIRNGFATTDEIREGMRLCIVNKTMGRLLLSTESHD